ncbi:hypothetical protein JCM8097_006998 [Rhodosporidiobolus ruineniae]
MTSAASSTAPSAATTSAGVPALPWPSPAVVEAARLALRQDLLDLHQEAHGLIWGQDNLRVTEGVPHLAPGPLALLMTLNPTAVELPVLVRREYLEFLSIMEEDMDGMRGSEWRGYVCAGSPGIGKSTFLVVYAVLRAERREPFILASTSDPKTGYLYYEGGVLQLALSAGWHVKLQLDQLPVRLAVLVDSATDVVEAVPSWFLGLGGAFTVVASSPRSERFLHIQHSLSILSTTPERLSSRLDSHLQDPSSTSLSLPASALALANNTILPRHAYQTNVYGVLELFDMIGGIVRYFGMSFSKTGDPVRDIDVLNMAAGFLANESQFCRLDEGMDNPQMFQLPGYHAVVHLRPDPDRPRLGRIKPHYEAFVPTKYLRALLRVASADS